ncbi:MAG TPA: hypothetical protein VNK67_13885 [Burkholderiales bacterium]|nr:hypothetical protein [Burkholderiales bacterium]
MSASGINETASPVPASVVVLRIPEFTRRPVAEQTRLKARLDALLAAAIEPLPAAGRIVLDAPEGAAVVVLGEPAAALDLAERSQAAAADLPLAIGVNHGPVRAAHDAARGPGLVGDGIASGMVLAAAAAPGGLLASRSFREALEATDPGRATELSSAGVFTDSGVRTHELYALDRPAAFRRRRRFAAAAALAAVLILGLGIATRMLLRDEPAAPAVVVFEIAPRGEVFVDGVFKGKSPPLKRLELAPGRHTVEIRNSPHPPLKSEINPGPGEELTLSHSFTSAKPPKAARGRSVEDYWRDFRRSIGF